MSLNETLYLIFTGTLSAIAAWIIINAIKYIIKKAKELFSDITQLKSDVQELKMRMENLEKKDR